jgi:hypothetical protein
LTAAEGSLAEAMRQFEKKFKDKSGLTWKDRGENPKPGKYAFVEKNYDDDSDDDDEVDDTEAKGKKASNWKPPKSTLEPAVQQLMQLIFNQQYFNAAMSSLNYDANKLPLGKLSKATITRGFQALKDLSALIDDHSLAANYGMAYGPAVEQLSNTFYSLIPHAFGRNRPPVINDQSMVKTEIELLESLSDMKDAALIMKMDKVADDDVHPLDKQYQGLKMEEMTPLDPTGNEYTQLSNYLVESRGATHGHQYTVESIFRIERQGERERFDDSEFGKMGQNRRLLWHGSRCTNFGGILSQVSDICARANPFTGVLRTLQPHTHIFSLFLYPTATLSLSLALSHSCGFFLFFSFLLLFFFFHCLAPGFLRDTLNKYGIADAVVSIQGLRIAPAEAPVSGYMFGKGIYLADMASKSANYCCSYISGGTALLLLCEAELGDPMQELVNASYTAGEDAKKKGMVSTWGQGSTGPSKWKDASCVHPSLAGVKMVSLLCVRRIPGATGLLTDKQCVARYIRSPRSYQRAGCRSVLQRVHLLRRRPGPPAVPAAGPHVRGAGRQREYGVQDGTGYFAVFCLPGSASFGVRFAL